MPSPTPVFETSRLIVRPWQPNDLDAAFDMYGDPQVMRYLGGAAAVPNLEAMRERLEKFIALEHGPGLGFWASENKETREVVGGVLLKNLPEAEEIEVGWHLPQKNWGKGYASEAGLGALRHGFQTVGLNEIYAVVMPENDRSIAVTKRLGMRHLGLTDKYYNLSLELFRILPTEFGTK